MQKDLKSRDHTRHGLNKYLDETSCLDGLVYQPSVYMLARHLAERTGAKYIIDIGARKGQECLAYCKGFKIIVLECDAHINIFRKGMSGNETYDIEKKMPRLPIDILRKSIVISANVIQHVVNLEAYLDRMAYYSAHSPFVLISSPDRSRVKEGRDSSGVSCNKSIREWTVDELHALLSDYRFSNLRTCYTVNSNIDKNKSAILSISGQHNPTRNAVKTLKKPSVLAIFTMYNEEDIIEHSIRNVLNQGVDVHIIDNASTDNSASIVREMIKEFGSDRVMIESFSEEENTIFELHKLLVRVDQVAKDSSYQWIIHHDSDEIRKAPFNDLTIRDVIAHADSLGYNTIDFTLLDFRPTKGNYHSKSNPEEFIRYFEYGEKSGALPHLKCWKNDHKSVYLWEWGGHQIYKTDQKVYPLKCLIKHYPLRSRKQAKRKIFIERLPRYSEEEKSVGWHHHYNHFKSDSEFIWDKRSLIKYDSAKIYQEDFVEFISGIGILDKD